MPLMVKTSMYKHWRQGRAEYRTNSDITLYSHLETDDTEEELGVTDDTEEELEVTDDTEDRSELQTIQKHIFVI